jgi:hypothetical protein
MASDLVIVAALGSLPPTLIAIATLVSTLRNTGHIRDLHLAVNSRLSELVVASKAQGRQEERDAVTAEATTIRQENRADKAAIAVEHKPDK